MQLMADAVAALGARHGLLMDPIHRTCGIIRFDAWGSQPQLEIRAGVRIGERELVLPLCATGETFSFHDQRMSPCTMALMGVDSRSMVKLKLTVATPFRPRDAAFSTTPALGLRLSVERLPGHFRWEGRTESPETVEIFLEFVGPEVVPHAEDALELSFVSSTQRDGTESETFPQRDRLVALDGRRKGTRFVQQVDLDAQESSHNIDVIWVTHHAPLMQVQGEVCPFKYVEQFPDLDAVTDWARKSGAEVYESAARVDRLVARNNCSRSVNRLLAQTLHSWLINTWWVKTGAQDVFTVWEGNCHFHSTVDVEFTQSPFYLAVWPELLGLELDLWPAYSKDGAAVLGESGRGTQYLSHDCGQYGAANGMAYAHDMEVEETANYILLAYAYAARTGDTELLHRHVDTVEKYLLFLIGTGAPEDGVPVIGVANTIDDASPAVQFGKKQIYLGVKALAAFVTGARIMKMAGREDLAQRCDLQAGKIRAAVRERGWLGDHFATLLDRSAEGVVDPWSGQPLTTADVPGWDAAHIYTANALAVLDMVGVDVGLPRQQLQTDLRVATERCLREYGCVHSDYMAAEVSQAEGSEGLAGASINPGWIAMNLLRDIAAFYRGVDLRHLTDRYWEWQTVANTQEPKLFFETFSGNNLCFYPRGVAIWGFFDALAGLAINRLEGLEETVPAFPQKRLPMLFDADWAAGEARVIET